VAVVHEGQLVSAAYTLKYMREISHSSLQAYHKMSFSRMVKTAVVYLTEVTMVSVIYDTILLNSSAFYRQHSVVMDDAINLRQDTGRKCERRQ